MGWRLKTPLLRGPNTAPLSGRGRPRPRRSPPPPPPAGSAPVRGCAMLRDLVARGEAARAGGVMSTVMALAPASRRVVGGCLAGGCGWPFIFLALGASGAPSLVSALLVVGETNRRLNE